jgi:hypothetical protein
MAPDSLPNGFITVPIEDAPPEAEAREGKRALVIDPADYPAAAMAVRDLLAGDERLFERGGRPVTIAEDERGEMLAHDLSPETVAHRVHAVAAPLLALRLRGQRVFKPVTLPARVAALYLALVGEWGLRALVGISTTPGLRDDGSIHARDGYDAEARIYRHRVPRIAVPERPTRSDAEAALLKLRRLLRTFPFADARLDSDGFVALATPPGNDESAALVALLTAACRADMPLAPAFCVRAPSISGAGAGKGLLVRTIVAVATGRAPAVATAGHDAAETDKRLVGLLLAAHPATLLDNVNATDLRSDTLASVLTEAPCTLRPLGASRLVTLDARPFVAVTGNGLTLTEDLARRFLVCDLEPRTESPELRRFDGDPVAEALRRRGELLGAALTIWRWGRQMGATLPQGLPVGSFGQWARWVRDPLLALGCRDPAARIALLKADDPRRRALIEAFDAWWDNHGDRPVRALDLAEPVRVALDPHGRGRQYLIRAVARLAGTRVGGFALEVQREGPPAKPVMTYRLRRIDGERA